MRSARVFLNHRCNQACAYCTFRREADDLAAIQGARVREAIDRAAASGAVEIVLSGGEPAMRGDLVELVAHARTRGRVVLETNATLLDVATARRLREAGLDRARVNLAGADAAVDLVTRDPGGFARSIAGLRALTAASIPFEIEAAVVRATLEGLPALPAAAAGWGAQGLVLPVPVESPLEAELLAWEEAVPVILDVERRARGLGLPVRLSPDASPPPCAFPRAARATHLFALTPGGAERPGYAKLEACDACLVKDACPGVARAYLARHPQPAMSPVTDEARRRRLAMVSTVDEQIARELVSRARVARVAGGERAGDPSSRVLEESVIRVVFHCNQACSFCFVSTHLPAPVEDRVERAIARAAEEGTKIVLSGGEPTLHPRLAHYVRFAKERSTLPVQIQTNAVRLEDPGLVRALVAAGLDEAFVSLHGATSDVCERVTEAPGTFVRTLAGLDALAGAGVRTIVNFVFCALNAAEAAAMVRLVHARWPAAWVNFSFVAPSSDLVPRTKALIPRYSDVSPHLAAALEEAEALGVRVVGLESMCGMPLCLLPGPVRGLALAEVPTGYDAGEFVKTEACRACALETRCYGVRRGYADLHGTSEVSAVEQKTQDRFGPAVPAQ